MLRPLLACAVNHIISYHTPPLLSRLCVLWFTPAPCLFLLLPPLVRLCPVTLVLESIRDPGLNLWDYLLLLLLWCLLGCLTRSHHRVIPVMTYPIIIVVVVIIIIVRRVFLSDEKILGCYHPLVAEDVVNLAEIMTALVSVVQRVRHCQPTGQSNPMLLDLGTAAVQPASRYIDRNEAIGFPSM